MWFIINCQIGFCGQELTEIILSPPFPKQLLTQICLAISMLVLHAVEHVKPIEKLFYSLQNLRNQDSGNNAVLETLTVLPEIIEDQNSDFHVTSARRYEYGQEVLHSDSCNCQTLHMLALWHTLLTLNVLLLLQLLAHSSMVLEFLMQQTEEGFESHVQTHDKSRKILRCLLSWVRICNSFFISIIVSPGNGVVSGNICFSTFTTSQKEVVVVEYCNDLFRNDPVISLNQTNGWEGFTSPPYAPTFNPSNTSQVRGRIGNKCLK